jgi:hypothetical protein
MTIRGVGSRIGTMAWESFTGGGWLRSIPKGMIYFWRGGELLCRKEEML